MALILAKAVIKAAQLLSWVTNSCLVKQMLPALLLEALRALPRRCAVSLISLSQGKLQAR